MFKIKRELEALRRSERTRDILERWSPEDLQKCLEQSRHSESEHLNINLILIIFVERAVTVRTKEIMKILLLDGADPTFLIPNGLSYLTSARRALKKSDVEVVTMFLDHLKDINVPLDNHGKRAIHVITQYQDESFLPIVLSYNPDLDIQDQNGLTALHVAVKERNYPKTRILVDAGVNVDIADRKGNTPLHCILADSAQEDESIAFLLLNVANVTLRNQNGNTPIHLIMKSYKPYHLQMLKILLDKGADPWEPNVLGCTALMDFVRSKNSFPRCYTLEILKILFEHDASSINKTDRFDNSILHIIARVDGWCTPFPDFIILFLEYGADPNLVNGQYFTVLDIYKYKNISQGLLLIKYLALKSFENKFKFGPELLRSIESHSIFAKYFKVCKIELSYLECSSFYGRKPFTLLDILTETSTPVLERYVKNRVFRERMAIFDVDIHSAYAYDLKKKFELGFERYEAEMEAIEYLTSGGLINFDCMESIVKFLSKEELRRIVSR